MQARMNAGALYARQTVNIMFVFIWCFRHIDDHWNLKSLNVIASVNARILWNPFRLWVLSVYTQSACMMCAQLRFFFFLSDGSLKRKHKFANDIIALLPIVRLSLAVCTNIRTSDGERWCFVCQYEYIIHLHSHRMNTPKDNFDGGEGHLKWKQVSYIFVFHFKHRMNDRKKGIYMGFLWCHNTFIARQQN